MDVYKTPEVILMKIAKLIHSISGINFPPNHLKVLDQRIQSKIKNTTDTEEELYKKLNSNSKALTEFVGYVTTNHTHFFRSIEQFNILGSVILPELIVKNAGRKHISLWSAACSSGEEPYSIALYIQQYFDKHFLNDWTYSILATDIDEVSLNKAEEGVYSSQTLKNIPEEYHKDITILPSTEDKKGYVVDSYISMPDSLKQNITFKSHNLMHKAKISLMDIIFCRNVLIYFDEETQKNVISHLVKALAPERYFFVSPTETLTGLTTELHAHILPKSIYYTNDQ